MVKCVLEGIWSKLIVEIDHDDRTLIVIVRFEIRHRRLLSENRDFNKLEHSKEFFYSLNAFINCGYAVDINLVPLLNEAATRQAGSFEP